MSIVKQAETTKQTIAEGRTRYLAQTSQLMTAVIDFSDGPTVPGNVSHSVQLLTEKVCLVDTFTPIRKDFL